MFRIHLFYVDQPIRRVFRLQISYNIIKNFIPHEPDDHTQGNFHIIAVNEYHTVPFISCAYLNKQK